MGLGTVLMMVNVVLIWLYTLSCHSCRHIIGGRLRHFSKHPIRYKVWTLVSKLNVHHARYAWFSLFSVAFVDLYIWVLAAGWSTTRGSSEDGFLMPDRHPMTGNEMSGYRAGRHGAPPVRRRRGRRRRCRPARRDRRARRRRADRGRLQVAARQGAHRDGRGRHRRGHGQPLARGQLGGALPRHHAWREDAQQLADGPAARPGGARAGAWSSRTGARCSTAPRTG